jgi:xanthine dehydrogenase molybdenum-binding subunit
MSDVTSNPMAVVGRRLPRVDAGERVTGRALYAADMMRPGMVTGAIKRSTIAHGRIRRIDTTRARALKGVLAIVTATDFPEIQPGTIFPFGETGSDAWVTAVTVMARDRIVWYGQPVAAVAAVDSYTAEAALDLIDVEIEPLPALLDIEAATAPDAPLIYPEMKPKGFDDDEPAPPNAGGRTVFRRGEAMSALASAAAIADIAVSVDTAHQGYLEPHACVAETDANGLVTIWASTQGVFPTELQTALLLGLPQSKIRVIPLEVGGAFGGKITVHVEPIAARLAQRTGRPVKIVTSREEVMQGGSGPAAAARIRVKIGADKNGTISAIDGRYMLDSGGIPGTPTTLLMQASAAPYQTPHLKLQGWDVITNKPRTEAYRGPGGIQAAFAMEQAVDELALTLGICPLDLRRRNIATTGSMMPIGTPFPSLPLAALLDQIAAHACWREPLAGGTLPRGRGLALGYWRGTSMTSAATVSVAADGRPMVTLGAVDLTGTRTAMAQVAAEVFQLKIEDVFVQTGDSKTAGYTDVSAGSRIGRTMAAAVAEACNDALNQLRRRAAERLQGPPDQIGYASGVFARKDGGSISLEALAKATISEGAVIGRGVSSKLPLGVEIGGHVCDVEVDPDTGQVTVLRYTAFQDVGRALNPPAVEGQIQGSVSQGIGWALTEHFDYGPDGRLLNASLLDYRMPTSLDLPPIDVVLLETPVPNVPFGVRGVAEMPIVPVAAAVANAVRRAVGVRLTRMPMTPERIVAAIDAASA